VKPISRILASGETTQTRVLAVTRREGGTAGAFRRRNPSQYSRYCFGLAPRTASGITALAPARDLFRGPNVAPLFPEQMET
jgi:hypothetical protein